MTMKCLPNKHYVKVNYYAMYSCSLCHGLFLELKQIQIIRGLPLVELFKSLKYQYGENWRYQWYRLMAAKQIIKSVRYNAIQKGESRFKLNDYMMFSLEDFRPPNNKLQDQ